MSQFAPVSHPGDSGVTSIDVGYEHELVVPDFVADYLRKKSSAPRSDKDSDS